MIRKRERVILKSVGIAKNKMVTQMKTQPLRLSSSQLETMATEKEQ